MDEDAVNILKDHIAQFLTYLLKNQADLFLAEYEVATPAYISKME
jgi:mortality factor 4-like protein 1